MLIDHAREDDLDWIRELFYKNAGILGSADLMIYRWLNRDPRKINEKLIVIRPYAFAHYLVKKTGEVSLYEIAVDELVKRQGFGRELMNYMGYPMTLKTDRDNIESNAFYRCMGFYLMGEKRTKSGKPVNIYQRFS